MQITTGSDSFGDAPLGCIGLGLMGAALMDRLCAHGHRVIGYDVDPERCELLNRSGAETVASAAVVARQARVVLLSLPDSAAVQRVLHEVHSCLLPGALIVDTTTGDPVLTAAIGRQVANDGVRYVDATIAGSSEQVRQGDVVIMAGGESADVQACAELFQMIGSNWFHVGPWGSGARMKLVVNLVLGLHRAVLGEGLCFAESQGLDSRRALEVLQASPAYSAVMDTKGERMLSGQFAPVARLRQHLKDVKLILAAAEAQNQAVPLSTRHAELLGDLVDRGFGDEDNSSIIRVFR